MSQDSIFDLSNIPEVWGIAKLDEIAKNERNAIKRGPFGSAIKKSFFVPTGYKVYEQKNVIYNDFKGGSYYISDEKFNELESFKVKAGDILMSCSGTVGRLAIVPSDFEAGIINQALLKITLNNNIIYTRFFFYLFGFNISRILQKNTRGSAMLNISSVRDLKNIQFPIPPLPEQHRIIAKIEELFTHLDAGLATLKNVQAQLKRYRQSVLKAALEGRLTAEWREQHKYELEHADKLLERILKERREMWETEQLAKYEAQGKTPPKNWLDKYKESTSPNPAYLFKLPEKWVWVAAEQVCSSVRDGTHDTPKYVDEGIPLVTSKNLKAYGIDFSTARNINYEDHKQISIRSGVDIGDVLYAMIGTIGNPVVVLTEDPFSIKNVGLFKRNEKTIIPEFLKYWLESSILKGLLIKMELTKGTTQKFIPLGHLRILPIPLPPLSEQKIIIEEIDKLFSICAESELILKSELKRAKSLRQSILKRAFEGKLVLQDPNEEPASVLLERIKAEKVSSKKSKQLELS